MLEEHDNTVVHEPKGVPLGFTNRFWHMLAYFPK